MDEEIRDLNELADEPSGWSLRRVLGVVLLIGVGIVALYLAVGFLAYQSGQALRGQREEEQREQQFARQIDLAQEDIRQGAFNLALHRLDWVIERDPGNEAAEALRLQAQGAIQTALTPDAPPTATAVPEPTVILQESADPGEELQRLQRLDDQQSWAELLPAALSFQRQYPDNQRLETDRLVYNAYVNLGLQQLQGNQIEQGIANLSRAEKLGDLPQEALDYWLWAELYLEGIAYYGVNWAVSASVFRDLCLSAPFYQNACDKLYDSLVNYADLYLTNEDFCPAVDLLREARRYGTEQNVGEKLTAATEGCALATPTPAVISGTLPITATEPLPLPPANE